MSFATILFRVLLAVTCAAAFLWGGRATRQVAVLYLAAAVLSHLAYIGIRFDFGHVATPVAFIDVALLVGLLVVTTRFKQWWLICASAMQTLTCLGHTAKMLAPSTTTPMGYFMMLVASSYPAVTLLAVGIWQHRKTVRDRSMRDRSLAGSSRRAGRPPRT